MAKTLTGPEQLDLWKADALDPRPRAASGWPQLDGLLRKQSFGPGQLVFLGGRMHTRKTAVSMNLAHNMLRADVPVGYVGLEEASFMYVAKLASVMTGTSHITLDEEWKLPGAFPAAADYLALTDKFSLFTENRPSLAVLSAWLEMESVASERKRVVFIDFLSLLERGKYDGKDTSRIPRLAEELKQWANEEQLCVIALHQVGRTDDSVARRYHGSTPLTPEQLMFGGEQSADIILATYRPALDPEGNLSLEEAMSQGLDQAEWQAKADRVAAYQNDTMLQLIKNRPGVELHPQGIRLRSVGTSQKMEVVV